MSKTNRVKQLVRHIIPKREYINNNLRTSTYIHFCELGRSIHLQRRRNGKWKKVAWAYNEVGKNRQWIIDYLLWHEKKYNRS